jgi:signal transduction histidine kinase
VSAHVLDVNRRRTRRSVSYCGPDRRGVIEGLDRPINAGTATMVMLGGVALPIGIAAVTHGVGVGPGAWSTGIADAAVVGFSVAAALLIFRWRLLGDAACVQLAAVAAIIGLYVVFAATLSGTMAAGVAPALRVVSVAGIAPLTIGALFGPEVRGDLRPARFFFGTMLSVLAAGLLLGLTPARMALLWDPGGIRVLDLLVAIGAGALAGLSVFEGVRRRRLLPVGLAVMLSSLAGSCATFAMDGSGPWQIASVLFLFLGAVVFVAIVGKTLQPAIDAVVVRDVRGRRRWEVAETQLTEAHGRMQVQRHDVRRSLSAIDGTLLVVATLRDQLPSHDTDRLLAAVRDEVHVLQANLGGRGTGDRGYDLSELIESIVSSRASGQTRVRYNLEQEIEMRGRRDRVGVAVDNLFANVVVHAPRARVTVTTRCIHHPCGDIAEITVSDDGPGLSEAELARAFERGWRSPSAADRPGGGIGLGQCRDLIEAEGGHVDLGPSDPFGPPGHRGLSVRITIPTTPVGAVQPTPARPARFTVLDGGAAS